MLFFCPTGDTKSLDVPPSEFGTTVVFLLSDALYKLQCSNSSSFIFTKMTVEIKGPKTLFVRFANQFLQQWSPGWYSLQRSRPGSTGRGGGNGFLFQRNNMIVS